MTLTTRPDVDESAAELQREMSAVRQDLRRDLKGVRSQAKQLTDWRLLVGGSPWISLAVAAAAGYVVVPRKRRHVTVEADCAPGDVSAREGDSKTDDKPSVAAELGSTAFQLAKTFAIRSAATLAARQFTRMMNPATADSAGENGHSSTHGSAS